MGYRSQVAGIFSVDTKRVEDENGKMHYMYDQAKFKEMIGFIKLSRFYELWGNSTDQDCFGWRDGNFILYGADWKWYPDYEDVKAWYELWESMQEVKGISGYFCRVGEERDDVEEEQFGDDPCYDYFHPFSAIDFSGENYLGKRETDEKGQTEQACADSQEV